MEIYLKDICGMVYAGNNMYYTFDNNGKDIVEFGINPFPYELINAKVRMIESIENEIVFYIYK